MTAEDYARFMPPHVKPEFINWLARRDREHGHKGFRKGFRLGHEHGWHEGQQQEERY